MSHYVLESLHPRHTIRIGWDPPLANFFLQVEDNEADDTVEDPVFVWLGADGYATETDVDHVLQEARRWGVVPETLRTTLVQDQIVEGTRPPRRLSRLPEF